jgi:hypothetical protein
MSKFDYFLIHQNEFFINLAIRKANFMAYLARLPDLNRKTSGGN